MPTATTTCGSSAAAWQRVVNETMTKMADFPEASDATENDMREEYDFHALQGVV